MDPVKIIKKFYTPGSKAYDLLIEHGEAVQQKALKIAGRLEHLSPDLEFIKEAAMLHDVGIYMTAAPELGCRGEHPYICHGYLGKRLLEEMGLPRHARVCERHIGVGISVEDIIQKGLPLPKRDMLPETIEEQIICYADTFFSKNGTAPDQEKPIEKIVRGLAFLGRDKVSRFFAWMEEFEC